jgi:hypothetical protein
MFEDKHGIYHAIPVQSGGVALRVTVEDSGQHNLLSFLNIFGRLYCGTVNRDYFNRLFQEKKQKFLAELNSNSLDRDLEFQLRMIRVALTTEWKWPAFINTVQEHGLPEWATGGSRILASGLCKKDPEQTITILFFDQVNNEVEQWLNDSEEITTDEQLHQALGIKYTQTQSPAIQISTVLRQINNHNRLFLHGIFDDELDGFQNSQELSELDLLGNLRAWQQTNNRPQLEIYTDWPELISDSLEIWNYQVVGDITSKSHHLFHPGHLERLAKNEHESAETRPYALYVKNPRQIDLSEFLIWVDLKHTTFIEHNWDFILYQRARNYNSKMISFSSTLK